MDLHEQQYRRIVFLASSALTFAAFAIWSVSSSIAANGGLGSEVTSGSPRILLLSCATLITCAIVVLLVRSYEDHAQISRAERYDQDTGLPNSVFLKEKLLKLNKQSKPAKLGLVCIGIDGLSAVNTVHGYAVGNQAIRIIADRLKENTQNGVQLFRMSGDTFAVLVLDGSQAQDIENTARQLQSKLEGKIKAGGCNCIFQFSLGAVEGYINKLNADDFVRNGELALLHARTAGNADPVVYSDKLSQSAERIGKLETGLRLALETDQIELHYQPIVDANSKKIVCVEALARWIHPDLGKVSPAEFVPLCEALGLNERLGNVILRKACEAIRPVSGLNLAVNISVNHFLNPNFLGDLKQILHVTRFDPTRLEIEITESVFIELPEKANSITKQLQDMGIAVALDDFGTGYTSLHYLKHILVDRIKIDAEFVRGLGTHKQDELLFKSIVDLIENIGRQITVEGIETTQQMQFLDDFGRFWYQGYLFGKPMEYVDLLRSDLLNADESRVVHLKDREKNNSQTQLVSHG